MKGVDILMVQEGALSEDFLTLNEPRYWEPLVTAVLAVLVVLALEAKCVRETGF